MLRKALLAGSGDSANLRVASFNILQGPNSAVGRAEAVDRHIDRIRPDVLFVQELFTSDSTYFNTTMRTTHNFVDSIPATVPGNYQMGTLSKFPIIASGYVTGTEIKRPPLWCKMEIEGRLFLMINVHCESWCYVAPCELVSRPVPDFIKMCEWIRYKQFIESELVADPDLQIILGGDFNGSPDMPQEVSFSEPPAGLPSWFVLGADIEAMLPLQHSVYPRHQSTEAGLILIEPSDTDGNTASMFANTPNAAIVEAVGIDYLAYTNGIRYMGSEILHDEVADQSKGLQKFGSVLPDGDSRIASDHISIFADFRV